MSPEYTGLTAVDVVIPINTALSNVVDLKGAAVVGLEMSGDWTAADMTFLSGSASGSVVQVHSSSAEIVVTVSAGIRVLLSRDLFRGAGQFFQIRSGTQATPVNQAAARTIKLFLSPPG